MASCCATTPVTPSCCGSGASPKDWMRLALAVAIAMQSMVLGLVVVVLLVVIARLLPAAPPPKP